MLAIYLCTWLCSLQHWLQAVSMKCILGRIGLAASLHVDSRAVACSRLIYPPSASDQRLGCKPLECAQSAS